LDIAFFSACIYIQKYNILPDKKSLFFKICIHENYFCFSSGSGFI
jgi:hypothetical protein